MPRQYTPRVPVTCATCGTIRLVPPSNASAARYCNRACRLGAIIRRISWSHI